MTLQMHDGGLKFCGLGLYVKDFLGGRSYGFGGLGSRFGGPRLCSLGSRLGKMMPCFR